MPVLPVMNECIFIPLIIFISLRPLDIHYRDNIAILTYISNITRLGKVLRETIVLRVLPNRHLDVLQIVIHPLPLEAVNLLIAPSSILIQSRLLSITLNTPYA